MGAEKNSSHCGARDSVCIQTEKVYDICKDKECLEDLRVYFSECDQALVNRATSVKFRKAEVLWASSDVEALPFNRGYFSVDISSHLVAVEASHVHIIVHRLLFCRGYYVDVKFS